MREILCYQLFPTHIHFPVTNPVIVSYFPYNILQLSQFSVEEPQYAKMLYNDILFFKVLLCHLHLLITDSAYTIYDKIYIKNYLLPPKKNVLIVCHRPSLYLIISCYTAQ